MRVATLAADDDFEGWRDVARSLIAERVPAADVVWQVGQQPTDLFGDEAILDTSAPAFRVPRGFVDLAKTVVLHAECDVAGEVLRYARQRNVSRIVIGRPNAAGIGKST